MTERRRRAACDAPGLLARRRRASLLAFAVVLALLVAQMRLGRDPVARRTPRGGRRSRPHPRRVLVRRVIVKRDRRRRGRMTPTTAAPTRRRGLSSSYRHGPRPAGAAPPRRPGARPGSRSAPRSRSPHERARADLPLHGHPTCACCSRSARRPRRRARMARRRSTPACRASVPTASCARSTRIRGPPSPASALLRAAVGAGLWAAVRTGGLVDPTRAARRCGARATPRRWPAWPPRTWPTALAAAPPRRAARPASRPRAGARSRVDDARGRRPAPARRRARHRRHRQGPGRRRASPIGSRRRERFAVDCGGDLRVGGDDAPDAPFEVEVAHPLTGEPRPRLWLGAGRDRHVGDRLAAVAAAGRRASPTTCIDPATGEPAWTGLVARHRARADRARGRDAGQGRAAQRPAAGAALLAEHGGVLVARRRRRRARRARWPAAPSARRRPHDRPRSAALRLVARLRAPSGIVALALVTVVGRPSAWRWPAGVARRPGLSRALMALHEHAALAGLVAIAVHGLDAARRPVAASRRRPASRSRSPWATGPAFTGLGHRRRLPRGAARAVVLRAPAHRRAAVAHGAPRDRARLRARPSSTRSARAPTRRRRGCGPPCSPPACRSPRCSCAVSSLGGRRGSRAPPPRGPRR